MDQQEHVHQYRPTGHPCIPDHGVPVCCAGCREVCACGMASCGHREDSHQE